jgi:hypothetical protein
MAIKFIYKYVFQSEALKNLPKLGLFWLKINHLATLGPPKTNFFGTMKKQGDRTSLQLSGPKRGPTPIFSEH